MGQTASQIENDIENKRMHLGRNLQELEGRVKSATDWRQQFQGRPMLFLGAAFGGGLLLAAITRSSSSHRTYHYGSPVPMDPTVVSRGSAYADKASSPAMEGALRAWENVKGALVGVVAQRVKDYAERVVPGFSSQYEKAEARRRS